MKIKIRTIDLLAELNNCQMLQVYKRLYFVGSRKKIFKNKRKNYIKNLNRNSKVKIFDTL